MATVQHAGKDDALRIDFPFQLRIRHPTIGLMRMFELSEDLDFHEVRKPSKSLEQLRHELIVDVIQVMAQETIIEVKPRRAMTYKEIAKEVQVILDHFSKKFNGKVEVVELDWLVDRKGLASDQRSTQRRVL